MLAAGLAHELQPFGLSEGEFRLLATLFSQPFGIARPSELSLLADLGTANVSRISDALVSRELIARARSDTDGVPALWRSAPLTAAACKSLFSTDIRRTRRATLCVPESRLEHVTAQNLHGMTNGLLLFLKLVGACNAEGGFAAGASFVIVWSWPHSSRNMVSMMV